MGGVDLVAPQLLKAGVTLDRERTSSTSMSTLELLLMQKHHNCRMTSQDPVNI